MTTASAGIPSRRRSRAMNSSSGPTTTGSSSPGMSAYASTATPSKTRLELRSLGQRRQDDPVRRLDDRRRQPAQVELDHLRALGDPEPAVLEERDAVSLALRHVRLEAGLALLAGNGRAGGPERGPEAPSPDGRDDVEADPEPLERRLIHVDPPDRGGRHARALEGPEEARTARIQLVRPADLRDGGRRFGGDGVDDLDEVAQPGVVVRLDPADGRREVHQAGDDAAARSASGSATSSATTARPSGAMVAGTPRIT